MLNRETTDIFQKRQSLLHLIDVAQQSSTGIPHTQRLRMVLAKQFNERVVDLLIEIQRFCVVPIGSQCICEVEQRLQSGSITKPDCPQFGLADLAEMTNTSFIRPAS